MKKLWLPLTFSKQNLWWLSPEFDSSEDRLYQRNAFTGVHFYITSNGLSVIAIIPEGFYIFNNNINHSPLSAGGSGLVTLLDEMFGTEGTMDFLKDNFFEVN